MEWCRLTIVADDGTCPDMSVVDQIARLALAARRAEGRLVVEALASELADLFELAGLGDLTRLGAEVSREPEEGEEPLGVERSEEDGQLGDLPI